MHCTILIPAYNTSKYIGQAISSAIIQTYQDFDILIVDDGSTDDTVKEATKYIPGNDISIIQIPHGGVAEATRIGIEKARGPIITVLDSDDWIENYALESVVPVFEDPNVGFAWSRFKLQNGKFGWSHPLPEGVTMFDALTKKGWWKAAHQRFISKIWYEKSPGLTSRFTMASDLQLAVVMASTGCETRFVDRFTYWYRTHRPGNISSKGRQQRENAQKILQWAKAGFK